jgi:hypothetical protein
MKKDELIKQLQDEVKPCYYEYDYQYRDEVKSIEFLINKGVEWQASQPSIIERLIEKGIWVEIKPVDDLKEWQYQIFMPDAMAPFYLAHHGWPFHSYPAALSDAIEYLRPLGYLEGLV